MSIKGFKLADGSVVKYDYSALENIDIDDTLSREGVAADASAVGEEITDLREDLGYTDISPTVLDGYYIDDAGFVGVRTYSQVVLIDLTSITPCSSISFQYVGTSNRCRLLFMNEEIGNVTSGTSGTYFDKGNSTTFFNLSYNEWKDYKTLGICTNYQQTPYATVVASSILAGISTEEIGTETTLIREDFTEFILSRVTKAIRGKYIGTNGAISNNASFAYIFLPYTTGDMVIKGAGANGGILSYWNSDKSTQLKNSGWIDLNTTVKSETIPTGTKWIGVSFAIADIESILVYFGLGAYLNEIGDVVGNEVKEELKQARHVGVSGTPLTLLHYSDIHADTSANARILADVERLGTNVDDMICTGDLTANAYGSITSWWNPNVMTVIGNHDTAKYENGAYDWTYLSMSQRDEYYIAPFESNWGVVHESGTSYYYKDYTDQKVRLIALDYMTYWKDMTSAESTTQTSWLDSLLADAITNNLHVLIAIHGPIYDPEDGTLTILPSQFSKGDNTFNASDVLGFYPVVRSVKSAISSGLNFVGYICGHTHQDNIYKTPDNQFFYCVTCGIVSNANQWNSKDLYRDSENDAYNLVTVDTTNHLIKLIRGGGADMDNLLRPRRTLVIDYENHTVVGEER